MRKKRKRFEQYYNEAADAYAGEDELKTNPLRFFILQCFVVRKGKDTK